MGADLLCAFEDTVTRSGPLIAFFTPRSDEPLSFEHEVVVTTQNAGANSLSRNRAGRRFQLDITMSADDGF